MTFRYGIGLVIVAEGIEPRRDLEAVKSHGVTFGPGYLLSRPAPLADFEPGLSARYPARAPA